MAETIVWGQLLSDGRVNIATLSSSPVMSRARASRPGKIVEAILVSRFEWDQLQAKLDKLTKVSETPVVDIKAWLQNKTDSSQ